MSKVHVDIKHVTNMIE